MEDKLKTLAIVQARLGSVRMPHKVIAPLGSHSISTFLHDRLSRSKLIDEIVYAIPDNENNAPLYAHLSKHKIKVYRGSENDVLDRYLGCAREYNADIIVRITGDCPFIDPVIVDQTIEYHLNQKADYTSNHHPPTFPDGFDVEVFPIQSLQIAHNNATDRLDREHVTLYIKSNSDFKLETYKNDVDLSDYRLTLDDPEDYSVINQIFTLSEDPIYESLSGILSIIRADSALLARVAGRKYNEGLTMNSGQKLWRRANKSIPGGNHLLSKKPEMFLPNLWPTYFSKAKGVHVWDLDNQKYLDMSLMGVGTNLLGYGNIQVDEAVVDAISNGNLSTLNAPEEVFLAESLLMRNPWAEKVRFARTGGEACAIAVRIARAASGKQGVAICGYHGWHDWYLATNLNGSENLAKHLLPGLPINGVPESLAGTIHPFGYNEIEELKRIIDTGEIGVIIMEVQRNHAPLNNFLQEVRNLASNKGIVLIFDECSSGFRETQCGLFEKYDVNPDVALYGKTLGNGYAITAIVGKESVMSTATDSFISSTFWTERIGFAAGLKTLEIFDQVKPWNYVTEIGKYLRAGWQKLAVDNGINIEITGIPAMSTLSFEPEYNLIFKTYVAQEMLKKNVLSANTVYLSTAHTVDVIDQYLECLEPIFKTFALANGVSCILQKLETDICQNGFKRLN